MKRLTDQDLEALLNDSESDLAERKQSFKGDVPKKARQAVCAFANDLSMKILANPASPTIAIPILLMY